MLTPSWQFKKMGLADFTLTILLKYMKQEWSSNTAPASQVPYLTS